MIPTRVATSWGSFKTTVTDATARSVCGVRSRRATVSEDAMNDPVTAAMRKRCSRCEKDLPIDAFSRDRNRPRSECKSCRVARTAQWASRPEVKTRRRRRDRLRKSTPEYQASNDTPSAHGLARQRAARFRTRHPERDKAMDAVRWAVESGRTQKPITCWACGEQPPARRDGRSGLHAHHYNGYDHPLDVMWLCQQCHLEVHTALREEK